MCAYVISFCTLFLYSGCGALNQGTFAKDETGAYTRHFWSCGPKAISDVMHQLKKSYHSDVEISREIQKNGNIRRFTLSVFNQRAMAITWPSEIKKYFNKRDLDLNQSKFQFINRKRPCNNSYQKRINLSLDYFSNIYKRTYTKLLRNFNKDRRNLFNKKESREVITQHDSLQNTPLRRVLLLS